MRKKTPGNYKVGYGKPPKEMRFQRGESGNPSGRPKGIRTHQQQLDAVLQEKITVNINGKPRRITKLTAMYLQLTNHALQGDKHALRLLLNQMGRRDLNAMKAEVERMEKETRPINIHVLPSDLNL